MSGNNIDLEKITPGEFLFNIYRNRVAEQIRVNKRTECSPPLEWIEQDASLKVLWNGVAEDFMTEILIKAPDAGGAS